MSSLSSLTGLPRSTPAEGACRPGADDFATFALAASAAFVPLTVRPRDPDAFCGRIRSARLDEVRVADVGAEPLVVQRTEELIARPAAESIKVSLQREGTALLVQDGREALLRPGDLAVYETSRPYTIAHDGRFRTVVAMLPSALVPLAPEQLARLTAVRFSGDDALARIVSGFLGQLADGLDRLNGPAAPRLAFTLTDLLTTLLTDALHERGHDGNRRRALLARVTATIEERLGDPDLTPAVIARANHISVRQLYALFHESGGTVGSWVRARRLDHCRRDLVDPLCADLTVSAIARRWGFTDASHFSQLFRERYGHTPRQARRLPG